MSLLEAIQSRRSVYRLTNKSPIPDSRIQEIVAFTVTHAPSAFNVQSARAVVLFREQHEKLWDVGLQVIQTEMPPAARPVLETKVAGLRAAYGSVLWFEDDAALDALKEKNPAIQGLIPEWSAHSSGMHQFIAWTALENEGLGCNLQHYNFSTTFTDSVHQLWDIPASWKLKAQLVFGQPESAGAEREKQIKPVEGERVLFFQ
ncbi:hypothetical protein PISL3812_05859 [Talaromyces islandicus]|uniref:Nitroreductase domain-containing protein n=1 Tax=Talaromyces islandicus TaxID=28573 RepID=A0A0U1LZU7_TALIS|nr:hypothetical protein PISL3812_05859 [Talaromyces islandicus]